jgi:hypothetical protein
LMLGQVSHRITWEGLFREQKLVSDGVSESRVWLLHELEKLPSFA